MDKGKREDLILEVLRKEFPANSAKQVIYYAGNRLNFSCPYCGDSDNPKKKRGNFYLDNNYYKCYNGGCFIYKDAMSFFRDFGVAGKLSSEEEKEIREVITENRKRGRSYYGDVDISLFFDTDIENYIIDRSYLMEKLGLVNVTNTRMERYLINRGQKPDSKFAWHPKDHLLYLFNLTKKNKILGLQVRNMDYNNKGAKYYTYKLSGIWQKLLKKEDPGFLEECKKIDPVSHVFNLGFISFDRTITAFEGPMDSWMWYNSVGLCSAENKFPFEVEDIRYWDDWDTTGRNKSIERLSEGITVFNWGKFLKENELPLNRKWDLNELVVHLKKTGKKVKRLDEYFTNDSLDLNYFIND